MKTNKAANMEKEFEDFWSKNQRLLVLKAPDEMRNDMLRASRLDTPIDWICFVIPVSVGILIQTQIPVQSEILSWIIVLCIVVVLFVLLQIVRPYFTKKKTETQVLNEIKQYYYERYKAAGKLEALGDWVI